MQPVICPLLPFTFHISNTEIFVMLFFQISTCSDDNTIKIWRLRQSAEEKTWTDKTSLVGWTDQKRVEEQNKIGKAL